MLFNAIGVAIEGIYVTFELVSAFPRFAFAAMAMAFIFGLIPLAQFVNGAVWTITEEAIPFWVSLPSMAIVGLFILGALEG